MALNVKDGEIVSLKKLIAQLGISQSTWARRKDQILQDMEQFYDYEIDARQGRQTFITINKIYNEKEQYDYYRDENKEETKRLIKEAIRTLGNSPNETIAQYLLDGNSSLDRSKAGLARLCSEVKQDLGLGRAARTQGEIKISRLLKTAGIQFIEQYQVKYLEHIHYFDFAITQLDRVLWFIEYDGIQHFKPVNHFGGEAAFLDRQQRDKEKSIYCEENSIPLIRIPYTFGIENITLSDIVPNDYYHLFGNLCDEEKIQNILTKCTFELVEAYKREGCLGLAAELHQLLITDKI